MAGVHADGASKANPGGICSDKVNRQEEVEWVPTPPSRCATYGSVV